MQDPDSATSFVEIVKRPGQTLGLYIREGNGIDRTDGVFISRIAIDSAVYSSGCLQLGDEILAVNLVDVTRMSLDDVVIIMSIPRRLVLTTRRSRSQSARGNSAFPGQQPPIRQNGTTVMDGKATPPVVVYKGEGQRGHDHLMYPGETNGGGPMQPLDSPRRDNYGMGFRDSRTLTWDRNPKPDRSDPKYFPVNSLPRQSPHGGPMGAPQPQGPPQPGGYPMSQDPGMPPPMRELSTGYPPMASQRSEYQNAGYYVQGGGGGTPTGGGPPRDYYSENEMIPGRGQRLLHRMASEPNRYGPARGSMHSPTNGGGDRRYNTLQYPARHHGGRHSFSGGAGHPGPGRSRHHSGLDYASDTEALHSPAGAMSTSVRMSRTNGRVPNMPGMTSRSSSLPRTFQREALLRHPELSMEMDRLADPAAMSGLSTDDQLSDSGAISAPESVITARKRGTYFSSHCYY